MTTDQAPTPIALPAGAWEIDPTRGTLAFRARGMFGLAPVKGTFSEYDGTLTAGDNGAHGELRITASSLDTGNAKRDTHLRSKDFFDVANSPTVTFTLRSITATSGDGAQASGTLQIRGTLLEIDAPLSIATVEQDRVRLAMSLAVDREAAGVGWSKMGMVQGKAHLDATIELVRVSTD